MRKAHQSTASEATGCHSQLEVVILKMGLLSVASGRCARGTVLVSLLRQHSYRGDCAGLRMMMPNVKDPSPPAKRPDVTVNLKL